MKNITLYEKAGRYDVMSCIEAGAKCKHCGKEFNFKFTDFYCLNMLRGLVYQCPHCGGKMYIKSTNLEKLGGAE